MRHGARVESWVEQNARPNSQLKSCEYIFVALTKQDPHNIIISIIMLCGTNDIQQFIPRDSPYFNYLTFMGVTLGGN